MYIYMLEFPQELLESMDGRWTLEKMKSLKMSVLDQLPLGSIYHNDDDIWFHIPTNVKSVWELKEPLEGAKLSYVSTVLMENLTKSKKELMNRIERLITHSYNEDLSRLLFDTVCDINQLIDDERIRERGTSFDVYEQ